MRRSPSRRRRCEPWPSPTSPPSIGGIDARAAPPYVRDAGTWLAFGLVLHFAFLQAVLGPIVPYLRRELDIGYTVASLHVVAFAAGMVAFAAATRRVERATSRRALVALGVSAMAAGGLGLAAAPVVAGTIAAAFAMGVGGTFTLVGAQAALADRHGERRAVALGEANVAGSLGALSVPLIVAAGEATGVGWRVALGVGAVLGVLLVWRVRAAGVQEPVGAAATDRSHGRLPAGARLALVLVFCAVCAEWSVAFWGATFVDDEVGLTTGAAVTLSSLFWGAMLAGRLAVSVLARRLSPERLVAASLAVGLAGFPVLWTAGGGVAAGLGLMLIGLGVAGLFPLSLSIAFAAAPAASTLASGRAVTASSAAVLTAPLVLGRLGDAVGLRPAFGVVPLFLLVAAVALALAARRPARVPAAA